MLILYKINIQFFFFFIAFYSFDINNYIIYFKLFYIILYIYYFMFFYNIIYGTYVKKKKEYVQFFFYFCIKLIIIND